jgi:hypothetical protein
MKRKWTIIGVGDVPYYSRVIRARSGDRCRSNCFLTDKSGTV